MTKEDAEKMLSEAALRLGEHFDAVQVLASWQEGGLTMCTAKGSGNWYCRQGMAHQFIASDIAETNAQSVAEVLKEEE